MRVTNNLVNEFDKVALVPVRRQIELMSIHIHADDDKTIIPLFRIIVTRLLIDVALEP